MTRNTKQKASDNPSTTSTYIIIGLTPVSPSLQEG